MTDPAAIDLDDTALEPSNVERGEWREWQPIGTAKKDGTWVLLYHKHARISDWYWDGAVWTNDSLEWGPDEPKLGPTHWMPLPAPPEDSK